MYLYFLLWLCHLPSFLPSLGSQGDNFFVLLAIGIGICWIFLFVCWVAGFFCFSFFCWVCFFFFLHPSWGKGGWWLSAYSLSSLLGGWCGFCCFWALSGYFWLVSGLCFSPKLLLNVAPVGCMSGAVAGVWLGKYALKLICLWVWLCVCYLSDLLHVPFPKLIQV